MEEKEKDKEKGDTRKGLNLESAIIGGIHRLNNLFT